MDKEDVELYLEGKYDYHILTEVFNRDQFKSSVLGLARKHGFLDDLGFQESPNDLQIGKPLDDGEAIASVQFRNGKVDYLTVSDRVLNGDVHNTVTDNDQLVFDAIVAHETTHLWQATRAGDKLTEEDTEHSLTFYEQMTDFLFSLGWSFDDRGVISVITEDWEINTGQDSKVYIKMLHRAIGATD